MSRRYPAIAVYPPLFVSLLFLAPAGFAAEDELPADKETSLSSAKQKTNEDKNPTTDSIALGDVLVTAQRRNYESSRSVGRDQIENMPSGNGDLTSLLRTNPSVQFDNSQLNGKTPGEIAPANISINGQPHWQNLFTIDGMGMNNDIDPGNTNNTGSSLAGRSQGLAVDTDLLDEIIVYDSNVPASFGGFNGGVIDAKTRDPKRQFSGKISAQRSRSQWTKYHLDENDPNLAEFEAGVGESNQPEFDKIITRATLEGYLTENFGLMGSFSRKRSSIPTRVFGLTHNASAANTEQDREVQIDNYFVKGVWDIHPDLRLSGSITYAPEEDRGFGSNALNSYRVTKAGGQTLNLALDWHSPIGLISQKLQHSHLENSRDSGTNYMRVWRSSADKDWTVRPVASDGSFGDIEQSQKRLSYQGDIKWQPIRTGSISHRLESGIMLEHSEARYDSSAFYSNSVGDLKSTDWCAPNDPWCSLGETSNGWLGQYMKGYNLVEPSSVHFTTTQWAVYLQNDMQYRRLSVRPGVRIDSDNYMDKTTVAPRFAAELDVRGNGNTLITAGANRYYGRNLATYRLREALAQMQVSYTRADQNAAWELGERSPADSKFHQLDIPYNDELSLAFSHVQWDTRFTLKYVERKARDQVSRAWGSQIGQPSEDTNQLKSNYYTYYNGGSSDSEIWSLIITPHQPLQVLNSWTSAELALDWADINSSGLSDYTSNIGALWVDDPLIMYDGSVIRYSDRPAQNYNRPWTARLTTTTQVPAWNLTWTNFLRHRAGYRRVATTGKLVEHEGDILREWSQRDYGSTLNWDTRISWDKLLSGGQAAFINLDVSNVLNKRTVSQATTTASTYETGRQFMVEVGYRF